MSRDTFAAKGAAKVIALPLTVTFKLARTKRGRRLLFWLLVGFFILVMTYNPN